MSDAFRLIVAERTWCSSAKSLAAASAELGLMVVKSLPNNPPTAARAELSATACSWFLTRQMRLVSVAQAATPSNAAAAKKRNT